MFAKILLKNCNHVFKTEMYLLKQILIHRQKQNNNENTAQTNSEHKFKSALLNKNLFTVG